MLLLILCLHPGADGSRLFARSLATIGGLRTAKKKTKLRAPRSLRACGRDRPTFGHLGQPIRIDPDHRKGNSRASIDHALVEHAAVARMRCVDRRPVLSISPAAAQAVPARTLDIAGNAEVHAVPDAALVSTGVVTESETAAAAIKANSAAPTKVLEAIRSFGVEGKDLQTSGLSLEARYYRPEKPSATDRPRIIGYTAANEIAVRVRVVWSLAD
jgi:Protein of unknown function (DUF541)